jgi:hypothetical protein
LTPLPQTWIERFDSQLRAWAEWVDSWRCLDVGGLRITNDHSDAQYDLTVLRQLSTVAHLTSALLAELDAVGAPKGTANGGEAVEAETWGQRQS